MEYKYDSSIQGWYCTKCDWNIVTSNIQDIYQNNKEYMIFRNKHDNVIKDQMLDMDNDQISVINEKLNHGTDSIYEYSALISDLEFFPDQNKNLFVNDVIRGEFESAWLELETLNAIALDEWEEMGKPKDFNKIWNIKYRSDAIELLQELIRIIKI